MTRPLVAVLTGVTVALSGAVPALGAPRTAVAAPALTLTVTANPIVLGLAANVTLKVTNTGDATASNVSIVDTMPATLLPLSGCAVAGQTVTCAAGNLAPGTSRSFTVKAEPQQAGPIATTATATTAGAPAVTTTVTISVPSDCTIVGTPGADLLTGTLGPDVICGLGGDDIIAASDGDDIVRSGSGDDSSRGGPGADVLTELAGTDFLDAGAGEDVVRTMDGAADDTVIGGLDIDICLTDSGDLRLLCP